MLALMASGHKLVVRFDRLLRYFGVGIINSAVGFGLYALFVSLTKNIYLAQILAHLIGMVFNYAMFRAHVFPGAVASIARYIGAYTVNYGLSLGCLYFFHHIIASPYLAGLLALITVAVVNYFVLKSLVFRPPTT
jgi:putative flippase GtrA